MFIKEQKNKKKQKNWKKKIKQEQDEQILKLTNGFNNVKTIYDKKFKTLNHLNKFFLNCIHFCPIVYHFKTY